MKQCLTVIFLMVAFLGNAQDLIYKNDKSEIKSKVMEITESVIKYKRWDNLEGPLYNISKSEVFMIIYANGQREIIQQSAAPSSPAPAEKPKPATQSSTTPSSSSTSNTGRSSNLLASIQQSNNATASRSQSSIDIDTSIDYKSQKVKYKPSRIVYWFQPIATAFTLGAQQESRLVKNMMNLGFSTDFSAYSGGSTGMMYSLYVSPYIAFNRLAGNYEKQDKGFFVHGKLGYSVSSVTYQSKSYYSSGLLLGFGADYFFSRKFGLSFGATKIGSSRFIGQGGISYMLL